MGSVKAKVLPWSISLFSSQSLPPMFSIKSLEMYKPKPVLFELSRRNTLSSSKKVSKKKFAELVEKDKGAVQLFAPKDAAEEKPNAIFSKKLYYSMVAGAIVLLGSFFIKSLIIFIFCKI